MWSRALRPLTARVLASGNSTGWALRATRPIRETVFGRDTGHARGDDHVTRASDAVNRGHEIDGDGQREPGGAGGSGRGCEHVKADEPRVPDVDLGVWLPLPASGQTAPATPRELPQPTTAPTRRSRAPWRSLSRRRRGDDNRSGPAVARLPATARGGNRIPKLLVSGCRTDQNRRNNNPFKSARYGTPCRSARGSDHAMSPRSSSDPTPTCGSRTRVVALRAPSCAARGHEERIRPCRATTEGTQVNENAASHPRIHTTAAARIQSPRATGRRARPRGFVRAADPRPRVGSALAPGSRARGPRSLDGSGSRTPDPVPGCRHHQSRAAPEPPRGSVRHAARFRRQASPRRGRRRSAPSGRCGSCRGSPRPARRGCSRR